jgi:hypothetical protein
VIAPTSCKQVEVTDPTSAGIDDLGPPLPARQTAKKGRRLEPIDAPR